MKPGQVLTRWWQDYVAGRLRTPQSLVAASRAENPDTAQAYLRWLDLPTDDEWQAPQRLKAPGFIDTASYVRQSERADWQHCDPRLMRWAALVVKLARKRGIPLYVHCAFRGEAEQAKVKASGNSKASYPRSAHNIGEAVDIVHGVYHWQLTRQEWQLLHVLGLLALERINATLRKDDKLHLTWGGEFKSLYDPAHWEITGYRSRLRRLPEGEPVRYTPSAILERVRL
ncbi:M15 family metallopeptidase [Pseudogemmobacter humi]|uniref:Peptidase M15C domain-containing protein n=1 Tax=Pseudogemmobacter humi TaxID=2483812 RepID=A0A3P5XB07_9RHOB|nr:M15 family metallopeptidase [Pseudogemmobacter humi]VDC31835.1 hypothetical protein XINFAN_03181 [Pseudogemmobacter humi]